MSLIRNVMVISALLVPMLALASGGASQRGSKKAKAAKAKTSSVQQTPAASSSMRFNMTQNGKRMTADEFDAWMKSRGVRVAKGHAGSVAAPAPEAKTASDG